MLSNAQNAIYINLNVDEMLPCYDMNAAGEDVECELTGRDLHPSLVVLGGGDSSTDGYRTLEADDSLSVGGYRTLEADDSLSAGGYRTLESEGGTVNSTLGYHTLERDDDGSPGGYWTLEGKGDDSSIASADVPVLGAGGKAAVGPCEVAMCEGDNEEETCV